MRGLTLRSLVITLFAAAWGCRVPHRSSLTPVAVSADAPAPLLVTNHIPVVDRTMTDEDWLDALRLQCNTGEPLPVNPENHRFRFLFGTEPVDPRADACWEFVSTPGVTQYDRSLVCSHLVELHRTSCEEGNAPACLRYAQMLSLGTCVARDGVAARQIYEWLCHTAGVSFGCTFVGSMPR